MPKSIFVSDLHASLKLPYAVVAPDATTSDRLEDVLAVIDEVRQYAEANDVDRVFVLGDLFNDRHPDAPTLVRVARALKELIGSKSVESGATPGHRIEVPARTVWLLPGNHDAHDRAGRVYSLGMFEELQVDGLRVATKPMGWCSDGIDFLMMPWLPDRRFNDALVTVNEEMKDEPDHPSILLIHQNIPGAVDGSYTVKKGVTTSLFEPWDLVLSGHIHKVQSFEHGGYLGSPLHLRFTDADDHGTERGFWVLDHEAFIASVGADDDAPPMRALTLVRTHAPRFVRWRFINDGDTGPEALAADLLPELLDELDDDAVPVYLEVIIEGPRAKVDAARKLVRLAIDKGEIEVELRYVKIASVVTDDGASERIREAITDPGKLAIPIELSRAFVKASEPTLPDGITADDLMEFAAEVVA